MSGYAPIVTVFGGSGFVGRYVTQRLARAGYRVRVAVRRPDEALFVRPYGVVGQVEPVQANIRDDASTRAAILGADAVINCVGILVEAGKQKFEPLLAEGAGRIARIAAEENIRRLVHVSAIGADADSESGYARAKAAGEEAVTSAYPAAVILRPSVVFGTEDEFFNRFASMARISPFLPVVSPDTKFQPVYVDDVAAAAVKAVMEPVSPGVYELGGPDVETFRELMQRMFEVIERKRFVIAVPLGMARLQAKVLDFVQRASFDVITNKILTQDQVVMLQSDNVVAEGAKGFSDLGMEATSMETVLPGYLYSFRPHGQYDAITASAENLRSQ
ncbi:complex I NDUFA9 subunit family protein [Amaricoccus tamworthensis]|uniref:complex I NDUFA9 subunit family protein n=1 Tax=Amaricoccus tamworthensis TaxID=57002 RepID=UPI003C7E8363